MLEDEQNGCVVDQHFAWTYVKTHECCCGPYFCR
ncbi:DUF4275 family protein [Paenibacillus sinopodophylli]